MQVGNHCHTPEVVDLKPSGLKVCYCRHSSSKKVINFPAYLHGSTSFTAPCALITGPQGKRAPGAGRGPGPLLQTPNGRATKRGWHRLRRPAVSPSHVPQQTRPGGRASRVQSRRRPLPALEPPAGAAPGPLPALPGPPRRPRPGGLQPAPPSAASPSPASLPPPPPYHCSEREPQLPALTSPAAAAAARLGRRRSPSVRAGYGSCRAARERLPAARPALGPTGAEREAPSAAPCSYLGVLPPRGSPEGRQEQEGV
ncbi:translation initiation factor IF-2-like [Indicator indicator]|uniref:translation initiation factor IF-2-like n=1 Tax=Indicator indicator TaxID=1002788 RepID=UPI0023DF3182|nr:translation initiation factor IF-2-like [Indicator indicator]